MLYNKEFLIWETEPYRVILRNNEYIIQDNIRCYKSYTDICTVGDKITAVLVANILCKDYLGLSINHRSKDVYFAPTDTTVREHIFMFNISEALDVEYREVTNE